MAEAGSKSLTRLLKGAAQVEPFELRAVLIGFAYNFFLFGSYMILRPIRDAMGTTYGAFNQLFLGTLIGTLIAVPIFGAAASRFKISTLLPWIYGFIALTLVGFHVLFARGHEARWVAGAFFIWISVFNLVIISVLWSLMADIFSRDQAKRLFGLISAGGSAGAAVGPAITALFVTIVGTNTLLLISAAGFVVTAGLVVMLEREKKKLYAAGHDSQNTTLDHRLPGNPFRGFGLVLRSPYLRGIAAFTLLMTWTGTFLYIDLQNMIRGAYADADARARVFAIMDLIVNVAAIAIQIFGTSRLVARFGVRTGLVLNAFVMIVGFCAVAVAPVLGVLMVFQVVRRISQYALAQPSRQMLFTLVDQESKYKAKTVIDTVAYRGGDYIAAQSQAWLQAIGFGVPGIAATGIGLCGIWWRFGRRLGRRYDATPGKISDADDAMV